MPSTTVAFLTANCMMPGHPDERIDAWEHEREFTPMRDACAHLGIDLREAIWDDPALDPAAFDAIVIGTTWDYMHQPEAFLDRLAHLASGAPLLNPLDTVRWNLDKRYLDDLAERGAPVIPTLWRDNADADTIEQAFDELDTDELVVKPIVGGGAWRQARVKRHEPLPPAEELPPGQTMIQPFLPAAASEGEYSFLYFDRAFSHALVKVAKAGDYRIQSAFGGREHVHNPTPEELALAGRVLAAVEGGLLYARVDMMRLPSGELALMELELIEPYLYPEQGPAMGKAFADALARVLDRIKAS